jgi:hypothetical protein
MGMKISGADQPGPWLGTTIGAAHGANPGAFICRLKTCVPSVT